MGDSIRFFSLLNPIPMTRGDVGIDVVQRFFMIHSVI